MSASVTGITYLYREQRFAGPNLVKFDRFSGPKSAELKSSGRTFSSSLKNLEADFCICFDGVVIAAQ